MPLRFTAQDMRNGHPMMMGYNTDMYYTKIGNQVLKILSKYPDKELLDQVTMFRIAEKLALYFEDIICDLGIWSSFVKKHQELYGKPLPFYKTEGEYYADEPHLCDIQYLIWDTLTECSEDTITNPENPGIKRLAADFYLLLDEEFENAPINEELKQFFEQASFLNDYIKLRDMLHWVFDGNYLVSSMTHENACVETLLNEVETYLEMEYNDPRAEYAAFTQCYFKFKVGPLALYPKEWLAMILRYNGQEKGVKKVEQITYHNYDLYRLEKFDKERIYLCDSDNMHFSIRKDDYGDMLDDTLRETDGCIAAFVYYDGEWHPNGMDAWNKFEDSHNAIREYKRRYRTGISKGTFKKLMKKSGGSPLFFFRDGEELHRFSIEEMGVPEHLLQPSELDSEEYITMWMPSYDKDFFLMPDSALGIKDPRNPYYDAERASESLQAMIFSPTGAPADMLEYLESHQMIPDAGMNHYLGKEDGQRLIHENLDFIVRTMRRENY